MTERSRVQIPAGTAGEFSSPGSTLCADSNFGIRSAWLYVVHRTCAETAAVSRGTSHASAVSTPLLWLFKTGYKKATVAHSESHVTKVQ